MGYRVDPIHKLIESGVEKIKEEIYELELQKKELYGDINLKKEVTKLKNEKNQLVQDINDLDNEKLDKIKSLSADITKATETATSKIRAGNAEAKKEYDDIGIELKTVRDKVTVTYEKEAEALRILAEVQNKTAEANNFYQKSVKEADEKLREKYGEAETITNELEVERQKIHREAQAVLEQRANVTVYAKDKDEALSIREANVKQNEVRTVSILEKLTKDKAKFESDSYKTSDNQRKLAELQKVESEKISHARKAIDALDAKLTKDTEFLRSENEALKLNKAALTKKEKKFIDEKRRFLAGR